MYIGDRRRAAGRGGGGPALALRGATDRFGRGYIAMALRLSGGNREKAAEDLGISPATLYRRLERFGLKGAEPGRVRS